MEINHILENARRLICDAQLLLEHGREESAASLGVIAIEEIGKIILQKIEKLNITITTTKNFAHQRVRCL